MVAMMKKGAGLLGALFLPVLALAAESSVPSAAPEDCAAIRARIGVLPPADPALLRTLAERRECGFTAAEVYRAAHGDKPPAPATWQEGEQRHHRERREHHDDD